MTSEQIRRWKLALGDDDMEGLGERDRRLAFRAGQQIDIRVHRQRLTFGMAQRELAR